MKVWDGKISDLNIEKNRKELISSDDSFTVSLICFEPGQREDKHVHRIINEVYFVLRGKIGFIVQDEKYCLTSGRMIFFEAGDIHSMENAYEDEVRMLRIRTKLDICDYTKLD